MKRTERWSISAERISAFFLAQDDVRQIGEGCYCYRTCEIRFRALPPHRVGSLSFSSTEISFEGGEEDTETIHRRYFLQFVSAGG